MQRQLVPTNCQVISRSEIEAIMAINLNKINQIVNRVIKENRTSTPAIEQHIRDYKYEPIFKLLPIK